MAKRRAEEPLLLDSPIKRRHLAPLCCVGMQPESMASAGGLSSPSILTLLGSRCRKRPHYSDNEASDLFPKVSLWDSGKFALDVSQEPPSGSFQDERGPCTLSRNKRPRDDSFGSDTVRPAGNDKTDKDSSEDDTYNSFQYWRVPLPELDLLLLEHTSDQSQMKDKSKDNTTSADAMES
ncbi:uncharacterized protein C9orf40 homolog isoform X1 [Cyprinodon tularosa]|uniref:uncharacterized protein C9orf40 homolog isoform X1 n=1 Tax=Cyprinodon tularosa TaxID=77115 RepID=UPI0018E211E3|nr:uncharacterized protein C9orf40 homolog isoform X1 [Cyprinodon tularosa]